MSDWSSTHTNGYTEPPDNEVKIERINFDARTGRTEILAHIPNVAMLAAECTRLLEEHDAKNYVQFDMIPRAESGVRGYRFTVQRIDGKSPAQRVIEMEKEVEQLRAQLATAQGRIDRQDATRTIVPWAWVEIDEAMTDLQQTEPKP